MIAVMLYIMEIMMKSMGIRDTIMSPASLLSAPFPRGVVCSEWKSRRWHSGAPHCSNQLPTGVMSADKCVSPAGWSKQCAAEQGSHAPNHTVLIYATAVARTPNQPRHAAALICMTSVARITNQVESQRDAMLRTRELWSQMKHGCAEDYGTGWVETYDP